MKPRTVRCGGARELFNARPVARSCDRLLGSRAASMRKSSGLSDWMAPVEREGGVELVSGGRDLAMKLLPTGWVEPALGGTQAGARSYRAWLDFSLFAA